MVRTLTERYVYEVVELLDLLPTSGLHGVCVLVRLPDLEPNGTLAFIEQVPYNVPVLNQQTRLLLVAKKSKVCPHSKRI